MAAVNDVPARELQSSRSRAQRSPAPGGFAQGHAANEARREERLQLWLLEISSFAEATTLLLLVFVAVPLKHLAGFTNATRIMGPVHGLAFLAFAWLAVQTVAGGGWRRAEVIRLLLGAIVPFGGYFNLSWLERRAASLR